MHFAVIMSGGKGRRFWPLSRGARAKQLMGMVNGDTLLDLTIKRLLPVFAPENILVVTQDIQADATERILARFPGIKLLKEPVGKNTGPCIAYASHYIRSTVGDAVIAFLPADHFIQKADAFRQILSAGLEFVEESGALLTLGIKPVRPATGFGYIKMGPHVRQVQGLDFYKVGEFAEKPSLEVAKQYLESGEYLWNAGVFVFETSAIIDEIARHIPNIGKAFEACSSSLGTPREAENLAECYSEIPEISIDFGVMEKTAGACVVPADIGWDDVGSWESFARYMPKDAMANAVHGTHVGIETRDCIVYSDHHLIATLGLGDIAIVATEDAILVMRKEKGEEVKDLVRLMESKGFTNLL